MPSQEMREQYSDSRKLAVRARLHTHYTVAGSPWFAWVASNLPMRPGDRLLDIGCGPGWFWDEAADHLPAGLSVTLADQSSAMVAEAMTRCQRPALADLTGAQADAAALPFEDASFDGVIAMHMLHHFDDPRRPIAEMHRVLKPGGFLGVTTMGRDNFRELQPLHAFLGPPPPGPAAPVFDFQAARSVLQAQFGEVTFTLHPAHMRVTDREDLFLAITSFPPGDQAGQSQLAALRRAIDAMFETGGGAVEVTKESGLFLSRKAP